MSDWGLQVFNSRGKAINVADASPLQFIRKINRNEITWSTGASNTFDFTNQVTPGTQLVVWTDEPVVILQSNIYLGYLVQPINITISGACVTIAQAQWGTGNWLLTNDFGPNGFWVSGIYGPPATADGWGLWVAEGGAFPSVVNSAAGMFLTQATEIAFTGEYALNCSDSAMVFCAWDDSSIGIDFDNNARTLRGFKQRGELWGNPGGFSIKLKICVFDIKTPTIPDWGLQIFGADGKTSFTSEETPLVIREWATLPQYVGAWTPFSAPAQTPMIPLTGTGIKTTNYADIWRVNLSMTRSYLGFGPGALITTTGDDILQNDEQIPYRGKQIPVIWANDYF